MPDLRTDLEAFRDEWLAAASASAGDPPLVSLCRDIASRLTALLAKHAKATTLGVGMDKDAAFGKELRVYPAGPDLRAMVEALNVLIDAAMDFLPGPEGYGMPEPHDESEPLSDAEANLSVAVNQARAILAAAPAAPKAEEAPNPDERPEYRCNTCDFVAHPAIGAIMYERGMPHWNDDIKSICPGTLVPFERRKGGEG